MRNAQMYRDILNKDPDALIPVNLAASACYAARFGYCEEEQHQTEEWQLIYLGLRVKYGENPDARNVLFVMDAAARSAAAAVLGHIGGSKTSKKKAKASRKNGNLPPKPGSKPRGRPRKVVVT
jgi:hypothetical protein